MTPAPKLPDHLPDLPGFRYVSKFSGGAMGEAHLYHSTIPGQADLVLKVIRQQALHSGDSLVRARFLREIETLKALDHPNVVRFFGHGEHAGAPYFTMEYCDGGDLNEYMRDRPALPLAEARAIILPVLAALRYLATAPVTAVDRDGGTRPEVGVVHRDLKPANILFGGTVAARLVKVSDCGLAKAFRAAGWSRITDRSQVGGTPEYMCRQQYHDYLEAEPEVDVWSAAAVLYFLLTKSPPRDFGRGNRLTIIETQPVVPIRARRPDVPAQVAAVVDTCLDDTDELRFKTAEEFEAEIERAFTDSGVI
ncbi:MAG: hypothetical protein KatS3mg108_2587 [Isosphaeraceae bacterium]|jgi:serine/threonine protein kinase|nr:MAG: hypothetical protein KatS3mg108_2587 [Isosphaeraceae bacterium]